MRKPVPTPPEPPALDPVGSRVLQEFRAEVAALELEDGALIDALVVGVTDRLGELFPASSGTPVLHAAEAAAVAFAVLEGVEELDPEAGPDAEDRARALARRERSRALAAELEARRAQPGAVEATPVRRLLRALVSPRTPGRARRGVGR